MRFRGGTTNLTIATVEETLSIFGGGAASPPITKTGLDYRTFTNNVAGSDIRINFTGANLPSRTVHTILAKQFYVQQTGYYAVHWWHHNDYVVLGSFHFSQYESGAHPYPAGGFHDTTGQSWTADPPAGIAGGTGSGGTVHFYELAGVGNGTSSNDFVASPGAQSPPSRALILTTGVWVYSAFCSEIVGGVTLRRTYYPDLLNNPSYSIVQDAVLANLNTPAAPAFSFGPSPWESSNFSGVGSGYTNDETPACILRGLQIFSGTRLSLADINTELANESAAGAVTAAGQASIWYSNKNPKVADISDKSGAGHTPVWANANRPLDYTLP